MASAYTAPAVLLVEVKPPLCNWRDGVATRRRRVGSPAALRIVGMLLILLHLGVVYLAATAS
jgi:hypothetical protein